MELIADFSYNENPVLGTFKLPVLSI